MVPEHLLGDSQQPRGGSNGYEHLALSDGIGVGFRVRFRQACLNELGREILQTCPFEWACVRGYRVAQFGVAHYDGNLGKVKVCFREVIEQRFDRGGIRENGD